MGNRQIRWGRRIAAAGLAGLALAAAAATASGEMRSTKINRHLCKTVRGGRFVPIPGFPGEKIDRRLIPDVRWMKRRFGVFITDGYSLDRVHSRKGEHPLGLAADIVPNRAKGGTWRELAELAHRAEPRQNQPVAPWRWVGWNGDVGHGLGDHLHLSWMHTPARPGHTARVVYTRKCPAGDRAPRRNRHRRHAHGPTGGTTPSGRVTGGTSPTGGISATGLRKLAPAVPEH